MNMCQGSAGAIIAYNGKIYIESKIGSEVFFHSYGYWVARKSPINRIPKNRAFLLDLKVKQYFSTIFFEFFSIFDTTWR